MIKKLIETLEQLDHPVYKQGSLNENEVFPDSFFTFWNFQSDESVSFDDKPYYCNWGYWVYFYSCDPVLVENELLKAKDLLIKNGFEIYGKGEDIKSDLVSHTGRFMTVYYKEFY